ncbi:MAG: hypothetical protein U0269_21170 [Polyangiales bacterium]
MSLRRLSSAARVAAVGLTAVATAHCSACASPDRTDSGVDAVAMADATPDTRNDGAMAPRDVVDVNLAALCAQVSDTPEQWQRLPFACDCDARIARHPEFAAPPLRWAPCADHAECFDLVADWRAPGQSSSPFEFRGREVDGQLYVFYGRRNMIEARDRFILSRLDGPPLVAWDVEPFGDANRGCRAAPLEGPVFGLKLFWSPEGQTIFSYVSIGGVANDAEWRTPVVDFLGERWRRALIPYVSAYGRDVAVSLGPTLWRSDPTTREFVSIAESADVRGPIEAIQLHGNQSWFLVTRAGRLGAPYETVMGVVEGGLPPQIVYQPSVPRSLAYLLGDDVIVIDESEPLVGAVGPTVIRIANRTTNPAEFAPRDLWRVPPSRRAEIGEAAIGGGWLALPTKQINGALPRSLVLLRLSDGARYELADEGARDMVAYVTADEVAFGHYSPNGTFTIRRIALRSLGTPLPPAL